MSAGLRPLALRANNFRGLGGEHALELGPGLTTLVGANGSGKSSWLVALEWCLFGVEATNKSKSGIDERGEWLLAHRGALGEVTVELDLASEEGTATLRRRRAVDAKARAADVLELVLPGGQQLAGGEVAQWWAWNQLPDWKEWRRSFCQHQEQSRARVTETADRSAAIAAMLGLGPYRQVNAQLAGLRVRRLEQCAREVMEELGQEQRRALESPGLELRQWEAEVERHGMAVAEAGEAGMQSVRAELLAHAARAPLELRPEGVTNPDEQATAQELLDWAPAWARGVTERLACLRLECNELSSSVQRLEDLSAAMAPTRLREADARVLRDDLARELGSLEELRAQLAALAPRRAELEQEQRRRDALGKLLRDALELTQDAHCPVCETQESGLAERLRTRLDEREKDELRADFDALDARERALEEQITKFEGAQRAHEVACAQSSKLEERVRMSLPAGMGADAALDEVLASWREKERRLREQCAGAESGLEEQRQRTDLFKALVRLCDARTRAQAAAGELSETPEFDALQSAIDAAAGFASDLEALGGMARELEEQQSTEQLSSVNASIESYFRTITGAAAERRVQVRAKKTAAKVTYQLVDAEGRAITSLLNQAAFNALSLATLFASGESRAREGRTQFFVLDDPGQGLDEAHQAGLARALAQAASVAPCLVATFPGVLASELEGTDSPAALTHHLSSGVAASTTEAAEGWS